MTKINITREEIDNIIKEVDEVIYQLTNSKIDFTKDKNNLTEEQIKYFGNITKMKIIH